jgi:hypothetical protein
MSAEKLKSDLHWFIDCIDNTAILKTVHMLLKKLIKETVAGNDPKGKAINHKDLIRPTEKSEARVKKRHYFSREDLDL